MKREKHAHLNLLNGLSKTSQPIEQFMPLEIRRDALAHFTARLQEPRRFLQVVAGPRQVGQTTLVRQALSALANSLIKRPGKTIAQHSISIPSALCQQWCRQRRITAQTVTPSLYSGVVDETVGIHVSQGFLSQTAVLFLMTNPVHQRLLHDPAPRALKTSGQLIDLVGQWQGYVGCKNFGFSNFCHSQFAFIHSFSQIQSWRLNLIRPD